MTLHKRGYFPRGGGHCDFTIQPIKQLKPANLLHFGEITKLYGWSYVAGVLPVNMAQQMADGATNVLKTFDIPISIDVYKEHHKVANDNGSGIMYVRSLIVQFCLVRNFKLFFSSFNADSAVKQQPTVQLVHLQLEIEELIQLS